MYISELKLQNFRSIKKCSLKFNPNINLITGKNAQGKTSILESIRMASIARSFKTRLNREIITFSKEFFFIGVILETNLTSFNVKFGWSPKGRKISINNAAIHNISDLIGQITTVFFCAQDFELVTGSPELRRKFLDIQLSQSDSKYFHALKNYHKILKHRNSLLKKTAPSIQELNSWTNELIKYGVIITEKRIEAIKQLNIYANNYLDKISNSKEKLLIEYKSQLLPSKKQTLSCYFKELITQNRIREKMAKYTIVGPHRDDIAFFLNKQPAKKYASKGQLKTIAISLKFAEAFHLKKTNEQWPILLIDDILSELDNERQQAILNLLPKEQQIFITSLDHKNHYNFSPELNIQQIKANNLHK